MRVGFALGNIGPIGTAENLVRIAQRAEALAYDSLWTVERLLWPVAPQTPYAATADGSLPEAYKRVLDPLDALTFVAAHTKKIALGTSVLDIPYHNPVMLARRVTTLDVLSGGRVRLGLGGARPGLVEGRARRRGRADDAARREGRGVPGRDEDHLDQGPCRVQGQVLHA